MRSAVVLRILSAAATLLQFAAPSAAAQDYPARPVRFVVPYLPGGAADIMARIYAEAIGPLMGTQVVVENRGGGGGLPAAESVSKSAPDGYTLVVSGIQSHVLSPAVSKSPPFDPVRDFTHVAYFGGSPNAVVVHPALQVRTFAELVSAGKASKEGLQYVSAGQGSGGHVAAEHLAAKAGIKLVHVAYRGGSGAIVDLIAGHVKLGSLSLATAHEHIKAGALGAVGIMSERRIDALSDVPTLKEQGYPDAVSLSWYGLSGPSKLPQHVVDKLSRAALAAQERPEVKAAFGRQMVVTEGMSPDGFSRFMAGEVAKWAPIVKALAKPD